MPEVETPVAPVDGAETPAAAEKVTFSAVQQGKITEIIREVSRRSGAEAREEAERLRKELEAARKAPAAAEDAALQLAEARAELTALKAAEAESKLKSALLSAVSAESFFDAPLAADLLRQSVKLVDGKPIVIDPATGETRLGADFNPMGLKEAAQELAQQKAFLVRGQMKPGAGSVPSLGDRSNLPKLETLFGPKSDGGAANKLCLQNPTLYRKLKAEARERGLIVR